MTRVRVTPRPGAMPADDDGQFAGEAVMQAGGSYDLDAGPKAKRDKGGLVLVFEVDLHDEPVIGR